MNGYTLTNLYNNDIINYIPDLSGQPVNYGQNQYLNSAMSGNLYQNYGLAQDGFYPQQSGYPPMLNNAGTLSNAGMNGFGIQGVGVNSNAGMNGFGIQGVGANSNAGMNGFGIQGVGANSNAGINGFGGGFGELGNTTAATIKKIPNTVWGLLSAGIAIGGICLAFKRGKKPPVEKQQGFFQKLFKRNK